MSAKRARPWRERAENDEVGFHAELPDEGHVPTAPRWHRTVRTGAARTGGLRAWSWSFGT
ncbi:hypothetical protein YWIDRAFT_04661 [Streptomyces sp. SceaMP-e96]|uniref:hypothetical protein n=1 Tax=Streptomyces nigrescens TaxID=1920 RepID=UPI0008237D02|nr:hypothetical protein YWIDRAFT_04661 [Streptomyces sp. SceaMP-e96]